MDRQQQSDVAMVLELGLGFGFDLVGLMRPRVRVRHCRPMDMSDYCNLGLLPHHITLFLSDYCDVVLFLKDC